jgi:cardiolipin synthase (CMP-forming)
MLARRSIPNAITVSRLVLGPVVFGLILYGGRGALMFAFALFVICGLLDKVDGWLARRWKQTSDFGIIWDPIADKVLVHGAMLAASAITLIPLAFVYFCIGRDLAVSGFRAGSALPVDQLGASRWGKWKTRLQFAFVAVALAQPVVPGAGTSAFAIVYWSLMTVAGAATLISAVAYARKY